MRIQNPASIQPPAKFCQAIASLIGPASAPGPDTVLPHGNASAPQLAGLPPRSHCGLTEALPEATPALGQLASAVHSQTFVVPDTGPQTPAFVVATGKGVRHLFGSNVRLITRHYPEGRITAIDAGSLKTLRRGQRAQLRRFDARPVRTQDENRLLRTIRKPVVTADLLRDRQGDKPRLVVLTAHSSYGSSLLSGMRCSEIAASLKANGLQNGDVISLMACFGADSLNFNSMRVAELNHSAKGYDGEKHRVLPPAQHLVNALGAIGLGDCLVIASHNLNKESIPKDPATRKIRLGDDAGQQYSETLDGLARSPLADASRIFRSGAKPSRLLSRLDATELDHVAPALAHLLALKPPALSTVFPDQAPK
jgi:hypothetical protein